MSASTAAAGDDTPRSKPWPKDTQIVQYAWYDPHLGMGYDPVIHIRVAVTPDEGTTYFPLSQRLTYELERALRELTQHLHKIGHTNGEEEDRC